MKKIGIITFHRAHNYGASLQCLALIKIIKNLSYEYEVEVIDYYNKKIEYDYSLFRIDKTNIKKRLKSFISSILFLFKNMKRRKKYNKYILDTFPLTRKVYDSNDSIFNSFDILICGSDQIWNPNLTGGIDKVYFLNVKSNAKKISYAGSLGSNKLLDNNNLYINLFNGMDDISVREEDGCKLIGDLLKKEIKNVLDPTLLICKEEWYKYIESVSSNIENVKYIFVYSPNNLSEFPKIVNFISNELNLGVVNFAKRNTGFKNVIKNMYCSNPIDFLKYLYDSEIIVVTSFHAVVFSILFHKKFWVISPKDNNSRVNSLLKKLGLQNRAIESLKELQTLNIKDNIDYRIVDEKLKILRNDSILWLKNQIEK